MDDDLLKILKDIKFISKKIDKKSTIHKNYSPYNT